jgi:hypothetical protein
MTRTLLSLTIAAAAALAGCNQEDHTIESGPADPMANVTANAGPIELPPSISASKIYRCKDNSIVYVDWLSDKKTANFRADKAAAPTQLKAATEGEAMTAEGYSLTGTAEAASITLTRPGKGSQSCKA